MAGETVIFAGDNESSVDGPGDWPGRSAGLSPREAEILALIAQGLSNQEIADRAYLSLGSVETYLGAVCQKVGVDSRARAVGWALEHGFAPDTLRSIDPTIFWRPSSPGR